jgi:methyl-accepting chemotaxis protein
MSTFYMSRISNAVYEQVATKKLMADANAVKKYIESFYGYIHSDGTNLLDKHDVPIKDSFLMIDTLCEELDIVSSILERRGDDFYLIATTIVDDKGDRLLDTAFDRNHVSYFGLIQGEQYIGEITFAGKRQLIFLQPFTQPYTYDVIGFYMVGIEKERMAQETELYIRNSINYMTIVAIICIIAFAILMNIIINLLLIPLFKTTELIRDLSEGEGDLTKRLKVTTDDELGQMAKHMNNFVDIIHDGISSMVKNVDLIHQKSVDLADTSNDLAKDASDMNEKSQIVSVSANQISTNANVIASSAEESSLSVTSVANATEELSATINHIASTCERNNKSATMTLESINNLDECISDVGKSTNFLVFDIHNIEASIDQMNSTIAEITKNTLKANDIAIQANEEAKNTIHVIHELQFLSKRISKIVNLINDIADQTNLLALNAAIEAASAGEAGKGFAVVANEIKNLSKQTADATDNISDQIEKIQESITKSTESVEAIINIIYTLSDIAQVVTTSMEEQNSSKNEISQSSARVSRNANTVKEKVETIVEQSKQIYTNVIKFTEAVNEIAHTTTQAARASNEIASNSLQASFGVKEITRSTVEVNYGIHDVSKNIEQMLTEITATTVNATRTQISAEGLKQIAEELAKHTSKFKL